MLFIISVLIPAGSESTIRVPVCTAYMAGNTKVHKLVIYFGGNCHAVKKNCDLPTNRFTF